jgi:hypothetical protein
MPTENGRSVTEVREDIEQERRRLAAAVDQLRGEIGQATDLTTKLRANLPIAVAGALAVGFVFAGGIGATMRYFARRGREHAPEETARVGRFSLLRR